MRVLCDVNVLLALCYDRHIHHVQALAWLDTRAAGDVFLCRSTQLSLLRLLCHPAVMGVDVCSLEQAWNVYDAILADERFQFHPEPEASALEAGLRSFTQSSQSSPGVWQDAYLAAFAQAAGLALATFDQGFRRFDGLKLAPMGAGA